MKNSLNLELGTISFWIPKGTVNYNDGKSYKLFSYSSTKGGIIIEKGFHNVIAVSHVILGKGRIDLFTNVDNLNPNIDHLIALTWSLSHEKISLYVDGKMEVTKKMEYS